MIFRVWLPWNAVAVAAGVAMVPPMACHGTQHGAMESSATPWDAVGRPWYVMGDTMAMPRKSQSSVGPCAERVLINKICGRCVPEIASFVVQNLCLFCRKDPKTKQHFDLLWYERYGA